MGCGCRPDVKHVVSLECRTYTDVQRTKYRNTIRSAVQAMLRAIPKASEQQLLTVPMAEWCKCRRQVVGLLHGIDEWRKTGVMSAATLRALQQVATGNLYAPSPTVIDELTEGKRKEMVAEVVKRVQIIQVEVTRAVRQRSYGQRTALAQRAQEREEWWRATQRARARWERVRTFLRRRTRAREILRAIVYAYMEAERDRWNAGPQRVIPIACLLYTSPSPRDS